MKNTVICCLLLLLGTTALMGANPILPGYFADPTVKKFGDTYYI